MARTSKQLPELGLGKGAQTSRGMIRANLILKAAANLFAEQGYDSVSINEIGFAAGVTGPAVYRYFPSKEALLVAIYEHLYRRNSEGLNAALAETTEPPKTLERLIDHQIELAIDEAEKIRIVASEERHLPEAEAEALSIQRRKALRIWTDVVRQVRDDLGREEVDATRGGRVLDAEGAVVAPGVIDVHTHYEAQLYWDPYCSLSGWHGVTTVVTGNCGFGFAPCAPDQRERAMKSMTRVEAIPLAAMEAALPWDWESFPEFLDSVERIPKSVNVLSYVPLGPMLLWVQGWDDAKSGKEPTKEQMAQLRKLMHEALDAGACGWSAQRLPPE